MRAQTGSIDTRITMAQQSMQSQNYTDATQILDTTLGLQYCNDSCKNRAQPLDATSYYQIGNSHLLAGNYSSAIDSFNKILTAFPGAKETNDTRTNMSKAFLGQGETQLHNKDYNGAVDSFNQIVSTYPYPAIATQVHRDLSKAILGQGETTRATSCTNSITYYQQLAKSYADTPEGQKAKQELSVPQDVKGHFTNTTPARPYSQIALVQGLRGNMPQGSLFDKWNNAPYKTDIQANGNFDFQGIPQGSYDLIWYANDGTAEYVEFIYKLSTSDPEYVANVGPLCTVDMGNVTNVTGLSL
ncbi:tetratricopeptide repeat protein [Dictyobacter kobayashii]|uniref:tetratricopeptide repeat protein n=1 Tax=Dictyobacter kobayashii TaxID=2014872 RepID=UPI00138686A5|nr:tetratricopeptide repeat protein [Dictyobacter kobayashii]